MRQNWVWALQLQRQQQQPKSRLGAAARSLFPCLAQCCPWTGPCFTSWACTAAMACTCMLLGHGGALQTQHIHVCGVWLGWGRCVHVQSVATCPYCSVLTLPTQTWARGTACFVTPECMSWQHLLGVAEHTLCKSSMRLQHLLCMPMCMHAPSLDAVHCRVLDRLHRLFCWARKLAWHAADARSLARGLQLLLCSTVHIHVGQMVCRQLGMCLTTKGPGAVFAGLMALLLIPKKLQDARQGFWVGGFWALG
ncbi:hypothetical protein COO60DRAFT_109202 [Scenedesmus sp. NREL 46B-D3]|nr:hypothetical protein COO60DRAFT_109202 [Scenedesmus sp. NREL 46B-D3]